MIFTSFEFLIFFLVVLVGHNLLCSRAADNWFLLFASYVFYMSWNVACGVLIVAISLVDFVVGRQLAQTTAPAARKWWVMLSIGVNLGLLGFFKYANFLTANVG